MPFPIFRQLKNFTLYNIAQKKVRDATSNDITFPQIEKLEEIAKLTFDPIHITEVMNVIWKRLNDGGKSWRHVLKALNLLEYLLKVGDLKVAEICGENIFLICMLQTYQCMEGNTDRGAFVRAKADIIFKLLNEPEFLAQERENAANLVQEQKPQEKQLECAPLQGTLKEQVEHSIQQDTSSSFISKGNDGNHPVTSTPLNDRNQKSEHRHAFNISDLITIPEVTRSNSQKILAKMRSIDGVYGNNSSVGEKMLVQQHSDPVGNSALSPIINANTIKQKQPKSKPSVGIFESQMFIN